MEAYRSGYNGPHSKCGYRAIGTRVRIPSLPPTSPNQIGKGFCFVHTRDENPWVRHLCQPRGPRRGFGCLPSLPPKKSTSFDLSIFLSKPQAWHIITTQSWISSRARAPLHLITRQRAFSVAWWYTTASRWWYTIPAELMIYTPTAWCDAGV